MTKPRLLVISHVLPFPATSGQRQRVYYTLKALKTQFHVTFLTVAPFSQHPSISENLHKICDDVILLDSLYSKNRVSRIWHRGIAFFFSIVTGLKSSNYITGKLEFSPKRVEKALENRSVDLVLFEYWHTADLVPLFKKNDIPCIIDTHNILWQSYERQMQMKRLPAFWKKRMVSHYRRREEAAWTQFDGVIAINAAEYEYMKSRLPDSVWLTYVPMGIDLRLWSDPWEPADLPRIAYYGGLGSVHNQQDALTVYHQIMPLVWEKYPQAELWIIGSNPPATIQALSKDDKRVTVTGFVERVQDVLRTISIVVIPWSGTYGFRSRIVEVMALGIPVITTPDAVYGMNLTPQEGLFMETSEQAMGHRVLELLDDPQELHVLSQKARQQVERQYSFEASYYKMATELLNHILPELRSDSRR